MNNALYKIVTRTYRDPQWQKSEDTEKKFFGSSTYLASRRPYMASLSAETAPTKMGTTFTECLHECLVISTSRFLECYIMPRSIKKYIHIYPSNTLARYGKCISMLCSASSTCMSINSNFPVAFSSSMTVKVNKT